MKKGKRYYHQHDINGYDLDWNPMIDKIGSSRIERLRHFGLSTVALRPAPKHALIENSIELLQSTFETWEREDGFPYPHRWIKKQFVRDGVTWKSMYKMYDENWDTWS